MKTTQKKCPFTKKEQKILHFVGDNRPQSFFTPIVVITFSSICGLNFYAYYTISTAKKICRINPSAFQYALSAKIEPLV